MYELLQALTLVFMVGLGILLSIYPFENYGVALVAACYLMPSLLLSAAFGWRLGKYLSTGRLRGSIGLLLGYIVGLIIVFPIIARLLKALIVNVILV
jgi:Ca2+/Na+ antiporter